MIYFNKENKDKLTKRFFKSLELDGYFLTSANEQVDLNNEDFGFKKLYLKNEYIYQKNNQITKSCDLFFKTPTDLLRATNLLKKNFYNFQYGSTNSGVGNSVRFIKINCNDYDKIVKFLELHSLKPSVSPISYR